MKKLLAIVFIAIPVLAFAGDNKFISTSGDIKLKKATKDKYKSVIVYLSPSEVPASAKRLGIIYNTERDQETAFMQVKHLAARAGGNAILFVGGKDLSAGERLFNGLIWPGSFKAKWNFIVYSDPTI